MGYFYFNGTQGTSSENVFLQVNDQTGYIAPDLAKTVGEAKASENFHIRGTTHEFWLYVPSDFDQNNSATSRVLYQKKAY